MDGDRFDTLTKRLATAGTTRRRLLWGLGGGLAGTVLAGAGWHAASAQGGNSACAHFCNAVFPPGPKRGQCVSDGANGTGLCVDCANDPSRYCPGVSSDGCCSAGQTCSQGTCCIPSFSDSLCSQDTDCCSDICQVGTCVPTGAGTCTAASGSCGNGVCFCVSASGGTIICAGPYLCGGDITGPGSCPSGTYFVASACDGMPGCVRPPCPPSFGCFTGDTRVAMADGTSRSIAAVAVGDLVLGQNGANRVVAMDRPRLGAQPLYALNGGAYFVTVNHPFRTEVGWKAIDPAAARALRPGVTVGQLRVGDRLLALTAIAAPVAAGRVTTCGDEPRVEGMVLRRIEAAVADPATPLFDLRVDGDHTYFANDLLVHNK